MTQQVRNTADEGQVQEAGTREKFNRRRELDDVRAILATIEGRRFIWRLLGRAKVFESVWEQSARIHYNAGQQDFGHFVMGEVTEAQPEALLQMMQESKKREESNA